MIGQFDQAGMDMQLGIALKLDREFGEDPESEILKYRHDLRQRDQALAIDFEAKLAVLSVRMTKETGFPPRCIRQSLQPQNVLRRLVGAGPVPIEIRETVSKGQGQSGCPAGTDPLDQRFFDARFPAANHRIELAVQLPQVGGRITRLDVGRVADKGQVALTELDRPTGDRTAGSLLQQLGNREPPFGVELVTRQPDEGKKTAFEDAADEH